MAKRKLSILRIIFEIIILYIFAGIIFQLGLITGIVYLVAITLAIFNGLLFRKKYIAWMIIFGTILGFIASLFFFFTLGKVLTGDILGAVVVFIIAIYIWRKAKYYRRGKRK